jgi:hypothetical protein
VIEIGDQASCFRSQTRFYAGAAIQGAGSRTMVPAAGPGPYGGRDTTAGQGGGSSSSSLWDRNHLRPRHWPISLFGARENVALPNSEPPLPRFEGDVSPSAAFSGFDTSASGLKRFVAFVSAELCSLRHKGSLGYKIGERIDSPPSDRLSQADLSISSLNTNRGFISVFRNQASGKGREAGPQYSSSQITQP